MRIGDHLYFAPQIKLSDLDFSDGLIGGHYKERIEGFYLLPAKLLADNNHAFASGLLVLCCIDSLSKQRYPQINPDRERYKKWVQKELKSFKDDAPACQLYDFFRNGLVHNSSLKKGMEFSFEQTITLKSLGKVSTINPSFLLQETEDALTNYVTLVNTNDNVRKLLIDSLKKEFQFELTN